MAAPNTRVPYAALREGDIILFTGSGWDSKLVACASRGISHTGIMLEFDGRLWLAHSYPTVPHFRSSVYVPLGKPKPSTGVHGVDLASFLADNGHRHASVLRMLPPLTATELRAMRDSFLEAYGADWEHSHLQLLNACCGCGQSAWCCPVDDSYFCSELLARLLIRAGRLPANPAPSEYTPDQVTRAVAHRYLGALEDFDEAATCCACALCPGCSRLQRPRRREQRAGACVCIYCCGWVTAVHVATVEATRRISVATGLVSDATRRATCAATEIHGPRAAEMRRRDASRHGCRSRRRRRRVSTFVLGGRAHSPVSSPCSRPDDSSRSASPWWHAEAAMPSPQQPTSCSSTTRGTPGTGKSRRPVVEMAVAGAAPATPESPPAPACYQRHPPPDVDERL